MIEEIGTVKKISGEFALIETKIKTTCSSCKVKSDCGTSVIAKIFNPKPELLKLRSPIALKEGQQVKLGIPEETLISASALVYMLPLGVFMAVIGLLQVSLGVHELIAFAVGIVSTLLCYWWVSAHIKNNKTSSFAPVIMGAVNDVSAVMKHEIPVKKLL